MALVVWSIYSSMPVAPLSDPYRSSIQLAGKEGRAVKVARVDLAGTGPTPLPEFTTLISLDGPSRLAVPTLEVMADLVAQVVSVVLAATVAWFPCKARSSRLRP